MSRTPEQVAADDNLTKAIDAALEAYGYVDRGSISLEYVVVVAQQTFTEDGRSEGSFCTLYRDGDVGTTRALGLLVAAEKTLGLVERAEPREDK